MSFNTFCNICFTKENIIKLCWEENERILNILISFISCPDIANGIIYLCINCCNKLEEYDNFRELCLTNFVRFRYLYKEQKKQLEIRNALDIETQLKAFVEVNVERPSGTPLIENYEVAQALRNGTKYIIEYDDEVTKIDLDELLNINYVNHADVSTTEYSSLENDIKACHENYDNDFFNKDQEKSESSVVAKYQSKPDRFEKSQNQFVSGTIANANPLHESADDTSDVSFNPENCVQDSSTDEEGSTHNENKTVTSDTVCNVRDASFSCKSDLDVLMRTHTGEKHYECDKYQKSFADIANLKIHKGLHTGKTQYKCDTCDLVFKGLSDLNIHKRRHIGEKPYKCDVCGLEFTLRSNLKRHSRIHTGDKPYKCDVCGSEFIRRSYLKAHNRIHTGEKPFKCDACGIGFAHKCHLNAHKRIHTGEKPYKCDDCGVGFTNSCGLKTHKLIHTGEKPFKCDECGLEFRHSNAFKTHKRIHSGEKPFKCDECGLKFRHLSGFNAHKRGHTGEKPYKCDECDYRCTKRSSLNMHKRKHTREKAYKCDECGLGFTQKSNLNTHKLKHTGEKL